jgi:olfactory receptor
LHILLLTMIAYDCFVVICHPLHYTVIMKARLCVLWFLCPGW